MARATTSTSPGLMAAGTTIYPNPRFSINPKRGESGIYGIINSTNGKIYVGSAVRLSHRWITHRMELSNGNHGNRYLQRAFNECPEAFEFCVLETVPDKSNLLSAEQKWMDFYRSHNPSLGYNLVPKAGSCIGHKQSPEVVAAKSALLRGIKRSDEFKAKVSAALRLRVRKPHSDAAKAKMSASKIGRKQNPEHVSLRTERRKILKWGYKPVMQMTLDGVDVQKFDSVQKAEDYFGRRTNIHAACSGKRNESMGFKWRYV